MPGCKQSIIVAKLTVIWNLAYMGEGGGGDSVAASLTKLGYSQLYSVALAIMVSHMQTAVMGQVLFCQHNNTIIRS